MNIENIKKLAVLKNSRKYLSATLVFPSDDEIAKIENNEYFNRNFILGLILSMYYSVGIVIHMVINCKSKYLKMCIPSPITSQYNSICNLQAQFRCVK